MSINLSTKKGARGRWRWYAHDAAEKLLAAGSVAGHATEQAALDAAHAFGTEWAKLNHDPTPGEQWVARAAFFLTGMIFGGLLIAAINGLWPF